MIKRTLILLLFCCWYLLILAGCRVVHPDEPVVPRTVVVLSLDGFRSDYAGRAFTPTLDSIAAAGVTAGFRPAFPSQTFANHYSMATGLYPDHHGLVNNAFYDADLDRVYRKGDPQPALFGGEPIWNTAKKQGLRSAVFHWIGSEYPVQGLQPDIWKPYDKSVSFAARADTIISWLQQPDSIKPQLIMWYFEEPDFAGHRFSPDSEAVIAEVEQLDRELGRFFEQVRQLPDSEAIDFVIVSDHGMATVEAADCIQLEDYIPADSFSYIFDGVPTLLYPLPSFADSAYRLLQQIPRTQVFRKEEMPDRFRYGTNPRIGDLILLPETGTNIYYQSAPKSERGGMHGYDNFAPEMEGIFYAAGPSFASGKTQPVLDNVNLYLILSRLLGLTPAPNDGDETAISGLFKK